MQKTNENSFFNFPDFFSNLQAQTFRSKLAIRNIRFSFLIFLPFTPLLTSEMRTSANITLQLETNFIYTHSINLKYFTNERMNEYYIFIGLAFIENAFLRKDKNITFLPYAGYGYAYRFGKFKA